MTTSSVADSEELVDVGLAAGCRQSKSADSTTIHDVTQATVMAMPASTTAGCLCPEIVDPAGEVDGAVGQKHGHHRDEETNRQLATPHAANGHGCRATTPKPSRSPVAAARPVPWRSAPRETSPVGARPAPSACRGGARPRSASSARSSSPGAVRRSDRDMNGSASGSQSNPLRSSSASSTSWSRSRQGQIGVDRAHGALRASHTGEPSPTLPTSGSSRCCGLQLSCSASPMMMPSGPRT